MERELSGKIQNREAVVGILGCGYVGLPLAVEFAKKSYRVLAFDMDRERVASINRGVSYIPDVTQEDIACCVKEGKLEATTDFSRLAEVDTISICVPTPLRKTRDPDISYIVSALDSILANRRKGQLIILESTTYPGTTREVMLPALECGDQYKVGEDFFLAFSPERVDPGNTRFNIINTPKIVGGVTETCTELARDLYGSVVDRVIPVSSPEAAEMVKLLENTFRSVNIGLVNELSLMSKCLNVNFWEVIDAAASKPFGFMPFYPGPGLGGHCIPIDPHYLSWKVKQYGHEARFIELAGVVNGHMPHYVVDLVSSALNSRSKSLRGSHILVVGVAYKKNVNDLRESPALDVMTLLKKAGCRISYYDPFIPQMSFEGETIRSIGPVKPEQKGEIYDCGVIITDHSQVDYRALVETLPLLVDTRNALKDFRKDSIFRL